MVLFNTMKNYTFSVIYSEEDKEYVGLCAEFHGLSWLEKTPQKAMKGIKKLVKEVIKDMESNHETIPQPKST